MKTGKSFLLLTLSTFNYDARVKTYATYLKENGYDVVVISSKERSDEASEIQNNGVLNYRIIRKYQGDSGLSYIIYYLKFLLKAFVKVTLLSFRKKFDFVHYNNAPNFIVFSCIIQKILGAKIILDNHDVFPLVFSTRFNSSVINKIAYFEQKLSMSFSDKILCADHNQFDYLVKSKIKSEKISIILNTPSPIFFRINSNHKKDDQNREINMVYHGTVSHRLGIDNILRAININRDELRNFKFHLIGTGDFLNEIKKIYYSLNLINHVIIYDKNIPVEELKDYLVNMDIGIIANRLTDISDYMLPVKLLEYVNFKIPVIAPRNKIITRYFTEDMLCYYEPENVEEMAEKILYLCNDKQARERFAANAFKFTEQYNYETEMNKYEDIIGQLLK